MNISGNGEAIKFKERRAKEKKTIVADTKSRKNTYRPIKIYEGLLTISFKI